MINEYQETLKFNPLKDGDAVHDHQISVCVRKRPLSNKEIKKKEVDVSKLSIDEVSDYFSPKKRKESKLKN